MLISSSSVIVMFFYLFVYLLVVYFMDAALLGSFLSSLLFAGKSVMEGPQQKRQKREPWTTEEDNKLKHYKTLFPNRSWEEIIQKAKLARDVKSVSHRWENYLKFDFNRAKFSEEEDHIINCVMTLSPDR